MCEEGGGSNRVLESEQLCQGRGGRARRPSNPQRDNRVE